MGITPEGEGHREQNSACHPGQAAPGMALA